ncbi:hypothetical protein [Spirulina sp. 06S082]|nr:hypothetical protein [Spirulina sp. 06S082]MEA5467298.1 hypothetical protein [Spirulina sp. 06S082]
MVNSLIRFESYCPWQIPLICVYWQYRSCDRRLEMHKMDTETA